MTKRLQTLLQRYGVELRNGNQAVEHATYQFTTILSPEQFAIFQAAALAIYIHSQIIYRMQGEKEQYQRLQQYHEQHIFGPYGIAVPNIPSTWGERKYLQAHEDYYYLSGLLRNQVGQDARSGKARNLYAAVLD